MVGIVLRYSTLAHIIIYIYARTRVRVCIRRERSLGVVCVKEGAGLGVHRAVGVGRVGL